MVRQISPRLREVAALLTQMTISSRGVRRMYIGLPAAMKRIDSESLCLSVLSMVPVSFLKEWIGRIFYSMNRL